jgi:hypothetical protein
MVKPAPPLPPDVQYQIRRERRRRHQVLFAVALLVMVVLLGIALIWVLWHNSNLAPAGHTPPEKTGGIHRSDLGVFASTSSPNLVQARSLRQ